MLLFVLFVAINLYNKAYLARRGSVHAVVNSTPVQVAAYLLVGLPCWTGFEQGAKDIHWPRLGVRHEADIITPQKLFFQNPGSWGDHGPKMDQNSVEEPVQCKNWSVL